MRPLRFRSSSLETPPPRHAAPHGAQPAGEHGARAWCAGRPGPPAPRPARGRPAPRPPPPAACPQAPAARPRAEVTAAALTEAGSASGSTPPAAATASATRAPAGRVTSPGAATWPMTDTTTVPVAGDEVGGADVVAGPVVTPAPLDTCSTAGRSAQV